MQKTINLTLTLQFFLLFGAMACATSQKDKNKPPVSTSQQKKEIKNSDPVVFGDDNFLKLSIVKKIHKRQARRMGAIKAFKKKGNLGESDDGQLKIRNSKGLSTKEKNLMEKLVYAENQDRQRVYQEMSRLQKWNEVDRMVLRKNMFETYLQLDPIGTYYYSNRAWLRK